MKLTVNKLFNKLFVIFDIKPKLKLLKDFDILFNNTVYDVNTIPTLN